MRREYEGAARTAKLVLPLGGTTADLTIACDDLTGWPDGDHPFFIVIDRTKATEEKILCVSRSENVLTVYSEVPINGRGQDGTAITSHLANAAVEHIWTATDADEANLHVNSTSNVHGVTGNVVGDSDVQELTNKSMDGLENTFTNLPMSAITNLVTTIANITGDITNLEAADVDIQTQITNLTTSVNNQFTTVNNEIDAIEIQAEPSPAAMPTGLHIPEGRP